MCGGCGGNRSTSVRVARNTTKKTSGGVIIMRHKSSKKKSRPIDLGKIGTLRTPGRGVRVARNKR